MPQSVPMKLLPLLPLLPLFLGLAACTSEIGNDDAQVQTAEPTENEPAPAPAPTIRRKRADFNGSAMTEVKLEDFSQSPSPKP
jgi:hypothetical protein